MEADGYSTIHYQTQRRSSSSNVLAISIGTFDISCVSSGGGGVASTTKTAIRVDENVDSYGLVKVNGKVTSNVVATLFSTNVYCSASKDEERSTTTNNTLRFSTPLPHQIDTFKPLILLNKDLSLEKRLSLKCRSVTGSYVTVLLVSIKTALPPRLDLTQSVGASS